MKLPYLKYDPGRSQRQILHFGGVNYSRDAREGELLESRGLSTAQFPCLSQRKGRKTVGTYAAPTGIYARGKLCVVDGEDLLYGGEKVGSVTAGEKNFATINTKIVIFPDKVFYDTASGEFGSLEARYEIPGYNSSDSNAQFTASTLTVPERYCYPVPVEEGTVDFPDGSGTYFYDIYVNPRTGTLNKNCWVVMDGELTHANTRDEYPLGPSFARVGWCFQDGCDPEKEYKQIERIEELSFNGRRFHYRLFRVEEHPFPAFEEIFRPGDAVELSGCETFPENNGSHIIRAVEGRTLTFDRDSMTTGTDGADGSERHTVTIERKIPDLTCLCESGNRIWGAEGQTIYASALGDPKNFFVYDGLSTDSYAVAVGTDGEFTACAAYASTVLFWKEDYLHKILGSYPAQYELYTYKLPGVEKGSEKSLCLVSEVLYYKGRAGFYAYAGGGAEPISDVFGERRFSRAAAGSDGERYYVSMQTEEGGWELYSLDVRRGLWLREDETHAIDFAYLDGQLYFLDGETGRVMMTGQEGSEEGPIPWSATFCPFHETTHGRKGYSRLYLRCELSPGAWVKAEVSADGAHFRQVYLSRDHRKGTAWIPIRPTRCDSFTVRLSGKGECVIKSMVREFTVGSEI